MLKFYRKKHCPDCRDIESLLKELDQNFQIVLINENDEHANELPEDTIFPALGDGDKIVQGSNAVIKRIREFETFRLSNNSKGDASYSNE